MQDRYEREQEEKYRASIAARKKKKSLGKALGVRFLYLCFGNIIAFILYSVLFAKLVNERRADDLSYIGIMQGFSIVSLLAIAIVIALLYLKDGEENRRLIAAYREDGFSHLAYFFETVKRTWWYYLLMDFVFQIPFLIFNLAFDYTYQGGFFLVNFYMPQLFFVKTCGAFPGVLVNALLLDAVCIGGTFLIQKRWLRECHR